MNKIQFAILLLLASSIFFCTAPGSQQQGGGPAGPLLLIIIIGSITYFLIKRSKKRNALLLEKGIAPTTIINQTNKRIIGIILASIGGVGGILFGLVLSNANNRIFLTRHQEESTLITYGVLTGISVLVFILGLIFILTAKVRSADDNIPKMADEKKKPTYLDELEKLASLKERGVITKEEFEKKKDKLLSD